MTQMALQNFDSNRLMTQKAFQSFDSNQITTQKAFQKLDSNRFTTQKKLSGISNRINFWLNYTIIIGPLSHWIGLRMTFFRWDDLFIPLDLTWCDLFLAFCPNVFPRNWFESTHDSSSISESWINSTHDSSSFPGNWLKINSRLKQIPMYWFK